MPRSLVDVLWIARYDYRQRWVLRPHHHSYFQIIHFLHGHGVVTRNGAEQPILAGDTHLLRPGEIHGLRADSLVKTLDVKFRVTHAGLLKQLNAAAGCVQWQEPGLAARFESIRVEGERKQPFFREICNLLMQEVLYLYLRREGQSGKGSADSRPPGPVVHDNLIEKTADYLRLRLHLPLTVKQIARDLGCSDRSLRMHFRSAMGIGPLEYLHTCRITHARSLIEFSDYALKEIAIQTGYRNIQHFNRMFKQVEGVTPAAWRDQCLRGIRKDVYINPRFSNRIWTAGSGVA